MTEPSHGQLLPHQNKTTILAQHSHTNQKSKRGSDTKNASTLVLNAASTSSAQAHSNRHRSSASKRKSKSKPQDTTPMERWLHESKKEEPWNIILVDALPTEDAAMDQEAGAAERVEEHDMKSTQTDNGSAYEWR